MLLMRFIKKRSVLILTMMAILLGLVACSSGNTSTSAPSSDSSQSDSAAQSQDGEETIKIGGIQTLSGAYAAPGQGNLRGIQLAVDEINESGGLLGRRVELISENDEGKPEIALRKAEKLALQDGVNLFIGANGTSISLALQSKMPEWNAVMVETAARAMSLTTTNLNDHYFRYNHSDGQDLNTIYGWLKSSGKNYQNWYIIAPDYAWGHEMFEYASKMIEEFGGTVVGNDFPAWGASDFSSYLTNARSKKADVIFNVAAGSDLVNILKQADNSGLFKEMDFITLFLGDNAAEALPNFNGRVQGATNYHYSIDTPENKEFVEKFEKKFGMKPDNYAGDGYGAAKMLFAAIEKAGSTDTQAIIQAMKSGLTFTTPIGEVQVDPDTHQAMHQDWVGELAKDEQTGKAAIKIIYSATMEEANVDSNFLK